MNKRLLIAAVLWIGMGAVSVCVGRYALTSGEIWAILWGGGPSDTARALFWNIRLPRVLFAAVGGGGLALAGLVFQTVFSNPLASPDVLGVSSGCSVGAVFAMVFLPGAGAVARQGLAFLAGIATVACALWLARFVQGSRVLGMVLAGIVVGSAASAMLMILKYLADPQQQLPVIEYWLMGGFQDVTGSDLPPLFLWTAVPALVLYLLRFSLKVLSLGDEAAGALGLRPQGVRLLAVACATLLVAAVVSVAGTVSWIGLIAPHLVRQAGGRDITREMGTVFFAGGILLLAADLCARSLTSAEIPVSIFTSLLGAVVLAWLLAKGWRRGREEAPL